MSSASNSTPSRLMSACIAQHLAVKSSWGQYRFSTGRSPALTARALLVHSAPHTSATPTWTVIHVQIKQTGSVSASRDRPEAETTSSAHSVAYQSLSKTVAITCRVRAEHSSAIYVASEYSTRASTGTTEVAARAITVLLLVQLLRL